MKSNRFAWIDISKALGIFLVVLAHTYRGITASGIKTNEYLEIIDSIIYTFHMPLFFFLSGIFFIKSIESKSNKEFLLSKIDTIAYPYLLWGTLQGCLIAYLASKGVANQTIKFSEVFQIWQPQGQFWFLHDLFLILLISAGFYRLGAFTNIFPLFVFSIFLYIFQDYFYTNILFGFLSKNWIFFLGGVIFNSYSQKIFSLINKRNALFMLVFFILIQLFFHGILDMRYENKGALTLLIALVSINTVIFFAYISQNDMPDWILEMGKQSMAIYLLHIFFSSGMRIFLHKVIGFSNLYLELLIGTLIAIIIPLMIGKSIQQNKIPFIFNSRFSK